MNHLSPIRYDPTEAAWLDDPDGYTAIWEPAAKIRADNGERTAKPAAKQKPEKSKKASMF